MKKRDNLVRGLGWNPRIRCLFLDPNGTSDDEGGTIAAGGNRATASNQAAAVTPCYFVHEKSGRSELVTTLFREIDTLQQNLPHVTGGSHLRVERRRIQAPPGKEASTLSRKVPKTTCIDYFDPRWFNTQPAEFRVKYRHCPVALPLSSRFKESDDWKTMDDEEFMKIYGNEVRMQFQFPTEEELANMVLDTDDVMDLQYGALDMDGDEEDEDPDSDAMEAE